MAFKIIKYILDVDQAFTVTFFAGYFAINNKLANKVFCDGSIRICRFYFFCCLSYCSDLLHCFILCNESPAGSESFPVCRIRCVVPGCSDLLALFMGALIRLSDQVLFHACSWIRCIVSTSKQIIPGLLLII